MHRPTKYTRPELPSGTTRLKRVFALLPTYVAGYTVWLEYYEVLEAYIVSPYKLEVDGTVKAFIVGEWKEISKRILQ